MLKVTAYSLTASLASEMVNAQLWQSWILSRPSPKLFIMNSTIQFYSVTSARDLNGLIRESFNLGHDSIELLRYYLKYRFQIVRSERELTLAERLLTIMLMVPHFYIQTITCRVQKTDPWLRLLRQNNGLVQIGCARWMSEQNAWSRLNF